VGGWVRVRDCACRWYAIAPSFELYARVHADSATAGAGAAGALCCCYCCMQV
jgi:hypothetical protein